ncbi:MAG TPA: tyrosine-type recombinase/integrase [Candidatus Dojkabacteria bacterium]|nr:tyrosine-type recombinase/integrase [Candidatus Dojkabacteria bacterium]HQF36377.1 tyrosine-type recombinase/integrase [Candidatus Dojkabacteria bacterium]
MELQANNFSEKTVKNYNRDLSIFAVFLEIEGLKFEKISKQSITLYKNSLQTKEYSRWLKMLQNVPKEYASSKEGVLEFLIKNTQTIEKETYRGRYGYGETPAIGLQARSVNRFLSAIRSYLKYLIDFDYDVPIPPDAIKMIKTERKVSQVAEFDELLRLIESPTELEKDEFIAKRNRALLELLFSTGMRISEIVKLNRDQLNKEGKIYIIGKGKKGRFVYLTERAIQYINEYLDLRKDDEASLFIPTRGGRDGIKGVRLSTNYIQEKLSFYRRSLGIVVPTTPHSLRHGFATYLAENGASPTAIQVLLGHESLNTTTKYVHASDRYAEKSHRKYHPLNK